MWRTLESQARNTIDKHMTNATDEAAFVKILIDKLTKDDAIFVSNSMPVRDIDNLLYNSEVEVYANRGANGIDGVVSTAIGMVRTQENHADNRRFSILP